MLELTKKNILKFDLKSYKKKYGANDWLRQGMYEGKCSNIAPFDWKAYLKRYEDLRQAGIHTKEAAETHWKIYGIQENRIGSKIIKLSLKNVVIPTNTRAYLKIRHNEKTILNPAICENYIGLLPNGSLDKTKLNVLVFDMIYMAGGCYIYLQNLINKYHTTYNFIILRETTDGTIHATCNDHVMLRTQMTVAKAKQYIKSLHIHFIFINSLATQSDEYIKMVFETSGFKIGITHDFSVLYDSPQPNDISNLHLKHKESMYDLIITQHNANIINMKLRNAIISNMPDFIERGSCIKYTNTAFHVAVIGSISELKGIYFLRDLVKKFDDKFRFKIFGTSYPVLQEYTSPYNDINELNKLITKFQPNVIIEASKWPETWSYTLTLSKTLGLPILYKRKPFISVVSERLAQYKAYSFDTVDECIQLIYRHKQSYFYTIKNQLVFPPFYESLFSNKFSSNLIVITSKIIVSSNPFNYTKRRSIYTSHERMEQTLKTIRSVRRHIQNSKILLIDNSHFKEDMKEILKNAVDIFLDRKQIQNIDHYTDDSVIKAFGEVSQLDQVMKYITRENLSFKNLFKISGRYLINDLFAFDQYDNNHNCLKYAIEVATKHPHVQDYYYTSFYKISYNSLQNYISILELLLSDKRILSNPNSFGLEQELPTRVLRTCGDGATKLVTTLGITQIISCWDVEKYTEQINI